jgi:streptogramin lyase
MRGIIMSKRKKFLALLGALTAMLLIGALGSKSQAAGEALLAGTIRSASGERMEGVTVSARHVGKTFTTTVFSDASGEYYFPRLDEGKYKVWAQAVGYEAAILEDVTLGRSVHRQELVLKPLQNFEMQLRGDEWVASLPEDTYENKKMKEVFRVTCYGGCHSPSHALKDRYDEKGWKVLLDMMMRQSSGGAYLTSEERNVSPLMHYWKDDLAAWLAKVRGPASPALKLRPRPRPRGEETLAVFWEYDTAKPGFGVPLYNDGSLWQLGPPNKTDTKNQGLLRATVDADGNPWFSGGAFNYRSFGKVDWQTGKLTNYKVTVPGSGQFAGGGEIFADPEGIVWTRAAGHLVRVDRAGKMELIRIPDKASLPSAARTAPTSNAATRNLRVWWEERNPVVCSNGSCRNPPNTLWMYEPTTATWAAYDNPRTAEGMQAYNDVYNVTSGGDSDGNGWWGQPGTDVMVKADGSAPGKVVAIKLPERNNPSWELFSDDDRKIFEMAGGSDPHGRGLPSQHVLRQVGAGPGPSDSVWGSGWLSSDLIRINIRTHRSTVYKAPLADCGPYHAVVDPQGQVWTVCHSADYLRRFDPKTERWTRYDLPMIGSDAHGMGVAPVLINGRVRVVVPSWTTSKTILMEVRTKEDVQALRAEVQKVSR